VYDTSGEEIVSKIPIIDLFAGAGGIGIGVQQAGGDLRLSVELDPVCCQTLRKNKKLHPGEVLEADVSTLDGEGLRETAGLSKKDPVVIVGGPPCQPFSKAAYWTDPGEDSKFRRARAQGKKARRPKPITEAKPDERRNLVNEFLELVIKIDADGFLFENVPSILHPRNKVLALNFIAQAESNGYKTTMVKANAADYGVPQLRERVFILGSKYSTPQIPEPTHTRSEKNADLFKKAAVTTGEVLKGFGATKFFEPEEVVSGKWEEEFREVPPGWNYKALTAWAGHPNPVFEAETRFWNFLLKLSPDKPSWTIAANPGPWVGPFHWDNRRLRTPELSALQSFPKRYKFTGNKRERIRQIGNAAPPLLVQKMAEQVLATLNGDGGQG
jgi:DNA (cytosine-5)-methyltransferase 1